MSALRKLGPKSREWLAAIDVHTADDLKRVGAVPAYLALKRARPAVSLNLLYALVGAVEGAARAPDDPAIVVFDVREPVRRAHGRRALPISVHASRTPSDAVQNRTA